MRWEKLGQVFHTETYAQCPTPLVLNDRIRVYYAVRDANNKSSILYIDLGLDDPTTVMDHASMRCLENGKPGAFDDEGQIPSFALRSGTNVNLYYSGWNSRNTVPYHNATGAACSWDGGKTFVRGFDGPIMDRTIIEPYLAVTPCIGANGTMFYISGKRWEKIGDSYEPVYVICKATSKDGWNWARNGEPVIEQAHPLECFSRPWVLRGKNNWHLWYCYRDSVDFRDGEGAYRIGYAESADGKKFKRADSLVGISASEEGWDSKMICYPAVFEAKSRLFMLYNGNTFGRSGFGLAVAI